MPKFDFKLEAKEFIDFLDDLPRQFTDGVLGDMAQKAASVVRKEARRTMPVTGELGRVGKRAVIIARNRGNRTERIVTIGTGYLDLDGKPVSVGKIIRHMTAGRQNVRKRTRFGSTGRVQLRGGDFIERAFYNRRADAIASFQEGFGKIIKRRAARVRGLSYAG